MEFQDADRFFPCWSGFVHILLDALSVFVVDVILEGDDESMIRFSCICQ